MTRLVDRVILIESTSTKGQGTRRENVSLGCFRKVYEADKCAHIGALIGALHSVVHLLCTQKEVPKVKGLNESSRSRTPFTQAVCVLTI